MAEYANALGFQPYPNALLTRLSMRWAFPLLTCHDDGGIPQRVGAFSHVTIDSVTRQRNVEHVEVSMSHCGALMAGMATRWPNTPTRWGFGQHCNGFLDTSAGCQTRPGINVTLRRVDGGNGDMLVECSNALGIPATWQQVDSHASYLVSACKSWGSVRRARSPHALSAPSLGNGTDRTRTGGK